MNRIHWHVDNALRRVRSFVVAAVLALAGAAGCMVGAR